MWLCIFNEFHFTKTHANSQWRKTIFLCSVWVSIPFKFDMTYANTFWRKTFSCEVCASTFSQSSYLKTHMQMHTGEKPFSCKVCSTAFSHSSSLNKKHIQTHSGEKLYSSQVYTQYSSVFTIFLFANSHANTYWRKTIFLSNVWLGIFSLF